MPADGGLSLSADWAKAQRIASTMGNRFKGALDRAVMAEAQFLRSQMVKGIASGAPGGNPLLPLSPMTLALRAAGGFGGTKPLIRTGTLRSSITIVKVGQGRVFVGVHRSAKAPAGGSLVNIAQAMEFGAHPTRTLRQRRYLMAKLRQAGVDISSFSKGPLTRDAMGRFKRGGPTGPGAPIGSKITIPARPFIGPVIARYATPAQVKQRFYATLAVAMGGDFGRGVTGKL